MRWIIFAIIFIIFAQKCFGDEAPVQPVHGGCVKPVKNEDIQLLNEIINIYLEIDRYHVEVNYTFKNHGQSQKVIMGFPNQTNTIYTKTIENFVAYDGNTKLETTKRFEATNVEAKDTMWSPRIFYECSELLFKENEIKSVTNRYSQEYGTDYDNTYRLVQYILKTGSLWKGNIESVKIHVINKNIPENELIARKSFFDGTESIAFPIISFKPNGFQKINDQYFIELKNIEPSEDIEIKFPPKLVNHVSASSQLENNSKRYQPNNVSDNNKSTAWVEGKKNAGIGEYLNIDITPYFAGGKLEGSYLVKKIGIINGYTKSDDTYKNNNRVKKIELGVTAFTVDEVQQVDNVAVFELKDHQEIQFFELNKPIKASILKFTIRDIYKGDKYDDTCISEIKIYPSDKE
jgi:hypothetical protein